MRSKRTLISLFSIVAFLFSLTVFTSCGGQKDTTVRSGSSMGNMKHKNKHVWGK